MTEIITPEAVENALGASLTEEQAKRLPHLIDTAIEAFLWEARIEIGVGSITRDYRAHAGTVSIRQPGVTGVHRVHARENPVDFTWNPNRPQKLTVPTHLRMVTVCFSYDFELPKIAISRLTEAVARTISIPEQARQGMGQFSVTKGPFTESGTYKDWAVGGQLLLSPEDKRLARSLGGSGIPQTIGLQA